MRDPRDGPAPDHRRAWLAVALAVVVLLAFRSTVADWNRIPTGSMLPAILPGDRILVDKLAYDLRVPFTLQRLARRADPARGDIATFLSPEDGRLLVKRVVAIPGDEVALRDNRLVVNGVAAFYRPEPGRGAASCPAPSGCSRLHYREEILGSHRSVLLGAGEVGVKDVPAQRVPAHHYLVLGDNRPESRDSRDIGLVHRESFIGRVTRVAFSLDPANGYLPRSDRWLLPLR